MSARPPPSPLPENEAEVIADLQSRIRWRGDQTRLAKEWGLAPCRISHVLKGRMRISDRIAAGLGYRRVTRWERVP